MANKLIWSSDLYKGFKLPKNYWGNGSMTDAMPWQQLSMEEKTVDWIKFVADYFEMCGWANVEKRAPKIQRNYWMRYGKLNPSDYIVNPEVNPFSGAIQMLVPPESQSPLEQFYPLAPNFVDVLRGEFIKRDNKWTIEASDPNSHAEMFQYKNEQFQQILGQWAVIDKQQALAQMGISEQNDPQTYAQEMQAVQQQLNEAEFKSKTFKTKGIQWAERVLGLHERRYQLHELEPDGFECGLITDSEYWHLDMLDDDFRLELLNPKWCDYHKGPGVKYVSDGDYFLWFDFMSTGDIINKFGRKMKLDDIEKLKEIYMNATRLMIPDQEKAFQGAYYDISKPWLQATDLNPVMNDAMLGQELAYTYMRSPNFDHNIDTDIFNPLARINSGKPQMFRVMRLYWRSLKKVGWLTRVHRDGSRDKPTWIDENYKITVDPVYDKSSMKEETKDNLLYGEHVDWTWAPEWRHVIKIAANHHHTFWPTSGKTYEAIYIDGGPVKFQFKGRENPFDSLPPIEGCNFSYINTIPHSFIDRVKPWQILYNICWNRVPKKILDDKGLKVAVDRRIISQNNPSTSTNTVDPFEALDEQLSEGGSIFPYSLSREALEGLGQPALPTVLQLSTVQDADIYASLADKIKWIAGESVGISRARMANTKPSDTATAINQGITYSETQTEKYYEQHTNLMQRVRQRMLDAAQYYTTFNENSRNIYLNDREENVFLDIEGMENLLPQYNINLQSKANVRAALQTIQKFLEQDNTLPIKASDKLEAMVENSLPRLFRVVEEGEMEMERRELAQQKAEMDMRQKELDEANALAREKMAFEADQNEKDRESNEQIALTRALGGLQSDNNADGQLDAKTNLDATLKQQEMDDKRAMATTSTNAKRQTDIDKLTVEREKAHLALEQERIRQKGALDVAKENRTAAEMKKKKTK